jgi:hypothetical protein
MHVQVQRDFRSEELVTVTSAVDVQGKAILDEGPRIDLMIFNISNPPQDCRLDLIRLYEGAAAAGRTAGVEHKFSRLITPGSGMKTKYEQRLQALLDCITAVRV